MQFKEACTKAAVDSTPLFLYINNYFSDQTFTCQHFEQDVLSNPEIIEALDSHFISLGISSESEEGRIIIEQFEMERFPYIATIFVNENWDFNFLGILDTSNLNFEAFKELLETSLKRLEKNYPSREKLSLSPPVK